MKGNTIHLRKAHMTTKSNASIIFFAVLIALCQSIAVSAMESDERQYVVDAQGKQPGPIVAVDNVCAWPNLTLLDDGTIIATIHNQPAHLKRPADVDCWASADGGRTWAKRGTPSPRDTPKVARGNVAAGVAGNGDLIVISSGWSDPESKTRGTLLPLRVSRSADGGRTWSVDDKAFSEAWPESARSKISPEGYLVPFGDILAGEDGKLRVALYGSNPGSTFVFSSPDDGKTWGEPAILNPKAVIHEPAIFHLGKGQWLAAARLNGLDIYRSNDDARTWSLEQKLTGPGQHPGHVTRLRNGRLLLTYGNRQVPQGVDVRFSDDEGKTWSKPIRVMHFEGDGGYPSSVQLPDGQVVTAYYAQRIESHNQYHMGVVIWDATLSLPQP